MNIGSFIASSSCGRPTRIVDRQSPSTPSLRSLVRLSARLSLIRPQHACARKPSRAWPCPAAVRSDSSIHLIFAFDLCGTHTSHRIFATGLRSRKPASVPAPLFPFPPRLVGPRSRSVRADSFPCFRGASGSFSFIPSRSVLYSPPIFSDGQCLCISDGNIHPSMSIRIG